MTQQQIRRRPTGKRASYDHDVVEVGVFDRRRIDLGFHVTNVLVVPPGQRHEVEEHIRASAEAADGKVSQELAALVLARHDEVARVLSESQTLDPKIGHEPMPETISFRGPDYDDMHPHLWTFFEAVRSRKPVVEDAVFGHHAALACHMANESYFRKTAVVWDEASQTIKS